MLDIEESILSPRLGLKGRLDASVLVRTHRGGQQQRLPVNHHHQQQQQQQQRQQQKLDQQQPGGRKRGEAVEFGRRQSKSRPSDRHKAKDGDDDAGRGESRERGERGEGETAIMPLEVKTGRSNSAQVKCLSR